MMKTEHVLDQIILEIISYKFPTKISDIINFRKMSSTRVKNYYEILGVNPNASQAEIDEAYKKLSNQWHPDRNK